MIWLKTLIPYLALYALAIFGGLYSEHLLTAYQVGMWPLISLMIVSVLAGVKSKSPVSAQAVSVALMFALGAITAHYGAPILGGVMIFASILKIGYALEDANGKADHQP